MRAIAPHDHAMSGVGLRLALVSGIPPTALRPKIKSLATPTLPVSRPRPGPVRLSLCSPGPETKHQRCKRTPRHRWAAIGLSPGPIAVVLDGPSVAERPHHGRPLDDESNLGWAVTRHPSCVTRLASSHLPAWSDAHSAVTSVCGPYTAYDSLVIEGSDITDAVLRRSHPRTFGRKLSRVWLRRALMALRLHKAVLKALK